jgi:hypothetical protein
MTIAAYLLLVLLALLVNRRASLAADVFVTLEELGVPGYPTSLFKYGGGSAAQLLEVNSKGLTVSALVCSRQYYVVIWQ